jgi:ABC-type nickel/cobalt efflux system permease component RcnA
MGNRNAYILTGIFGTLMTITLLGLGFVLGLKHALDADHIAAVAALASRERGLIRSSVLGMYWGLGHTTALLLAAIILLTLEIRIPETVALFLEFGVACMLVLIGANALLRISKGAQIHHHRHRHGLLAHTHPHIHDDSRTGPKGREHHGLTIEAASPKRTSRSSFMVGVVHGLAGSAGLMLLLAATIQEFWWGLWYVLSFGVGSIVGMLIISTAIGIPSLIMANRFQRAYLIAQTVAGAGSVGIGSILGWQILENLIAGIGT